MKRIKINGKEYFVEKETTIYEFLREIGIYIPTLCYHPHLSKVGACRVCVVIDRGKYRNSCATYIEDGMDIKTHTQELVSIRKWILQFLFAERNHYCMFCPVTNDCEFQNLGYYTGLDNIYFSTFKNLFDLDNSHPYILFDNNRCVLCTRCIRVCSEVAGHSVLSIKEKGIHSVIVADNDVPFGQSSCASCGLCVQVCPTGTFVDKYSIYLAKTNQTERHKSFCFSCPVGCGIEIFTRDSNIVKIYSDWDSFTKGLICYKGRYESVLNYRTNKQNKKYQEITFTDIQKLVSSDQNCIAVVDGTLFNEELEFVKNTFKKVFVAYRINPDIIENNVGLDDLDSYQTYIVSGWDLNKDYGTIGSVLKRNAEHKNHKIIYFDTLDQNQIKLRDIVMGKAIYIYRNYPKHNLEEFDHLVLPLESNDVGILKIFGKENLEYLDNFDSDDFNLFVFSRHLKADISNVVKKAKRSFLFTFHINGFSDLFDVVYRIPSEFETNGTFYNLFNQILSVRKVC